MRRDHCPHFSDDKTESKLSNRLSFPLLVNRTRPVRLFSPTNHSWFPKLESRDLSISCCSLVGWYKGVVSSPDRCALTNKKDPQLDGSIMRTGSVLSL